MHQSFENCLLLSMPHPVGGWGVVTSRNIKEQSDPASPDQGSPLSCATVLLMCQKKNTFSIFVEPIVRCRAMLRIRIRFFRTVKQAKKLFANYKKSIGQLEDFF